MYAARIRQQPRRGAVVADVGFQGRIGAQPATSTRPQECPRDGIYDVVTTSMPEDAYFAPRDSLVNGRASWSS
jgi:hypothetical protein